MSDKEYEDALLSREQAIQFLNRIGVENGEEMIEKDKQAFLNSILAGCMTHLPMQNISMLSVSEEERKVPSLEEIVDACLSLEGGVCFTLNTFMCILLRILDINAHVIDGYYSASPLPHTHVAVFVKDLRYPEDDHIVDIGSGYPCLESVAIADLPITYKEAGLEYSYARDGDTIMRLHRIGDDRHPKEQSVMVGEWRQAFHCILNPVHYSFFYKPMEALYKSNQSACLLHLRAIRFPHKSFIENPTSSIGHQSPVEEIEKNGAEITKDERKIGTNEEEKEDKKEDTDEKRGEEEGAGENQNAVSQEPNSDEENDEVEEGEVIVDRKMASILKKAKQNTARILLAVRNQSLLIGPMCEVEKTKLEEFNEWTATIKRFFPNIPEHKVDNAVTNIQGRNMIY